MTASDVIREANAWLNRPGKASNPRAAVHHITALIAQVEGLTAEVELVHAKADHGCYHEHCDDCDGPRPEGGGR